MIDRIRGSILEKTPTHVVVDCGGLGYLVQISLTTFDAIGVEKSVNLFTHYSVSVDVRSGASQHSLFGFATASEREVFRTLIDVSGVSSNLARTILSTLSPQELEGAVVNGDLAAFKPVKGVGPKLATRIVQELSGKLELSQDADGISGVSGNTIKQEALGALVALGFDRKKSNEVLKKVMNELGQDTTVEAVVKAALKHF